MKAKKHLNEFKAKHGISDGEIWKQHELIKLMEGYEYSHREVKTLNIDDVSNQRELLIAFCKEVNKTNNCSFLEEMANKFIDKSNL